MWIAYGRNEIGGIKLVAHFSASCYNEAMARAENIFVFVISVERVAA